MDKAVRIHEVGGPSVMKLEEVVVPAPEAGEAVVRQAAVGVNFIDVYHRTGLYPLPLPATIGLEGAGVVEAVGPDVSDVRPGDRVAYAGGPIGAYAERRVVPVSRLVPLPPEISFETAAAATLKGMTAWYLIRRTHRVERGESILVHAAAGGVGQILCQWAAGLGAKVIGAVGSEAKAEIALAHGCAHAIVLGRGNFAAKVRELTGGEGVAVVYD
ncbi:MAG: quinone oxidoreductase, partial [Candidatus Polarisedimenticolia bacterium]